MYAQWKSWPLRWSYDKASDQHKGICAEIQLLYCLQHDRALFSAGQFKADVVKVWSSRMGVTQSKKNEPKRRYGFHKRTIASTRAQRIQTLPVRFTASPVKTKHTHTLCDPGVNLNVGLIQPGSHSLLSCGCVHWYAQLQTCWD